MCNKSRALMYAWIPLLAAASCAGRIDRAGDAAPSTAAALQLSQPRHVEVLPFTKPKSFDTDAIPDGIEVTLRTLDAMGDAVKAWGSFHFELHRYRPASGDPHGERLQSWTVQLGSIALQSGYWDRVTQTYRFPLGWEGTPLEPQHKYVLDVSFSPTWGDRVYAKAYVFEFVPDIEALRGSVKKQ